MEVSEVLTIMALFFIGASFLIFLNKGLPKLTNVNRKKASSEDMEGWLKKRIRDLQEIHAEEMKTIREQLKTAQGAANKFSGLYRKAKEGQFEEEDEDEVDLSQYYIDKEAVKPFLSKFGMNEEALSSPYLQTIIMDKLKGNEELALLLGIIKPKSFAGQEPNQTSNQSSFNDEFQKLVEAGNVA